MMLSHRLTARLVGVLYILGTVAGVLSVVTAGTMLSGSDYLTEAAAHEDRIVLGALLVLAMGLVLALVPVLMYPILKTHDEVLALGYVVFRGALEMFTYLALTIVWLVLLSVSRAAVQAGAPGDAPFHSTGIVLQEAEDWVSALLAIVFILGAVMFYTVLYRSRLIPRWLSGWGLLGTVPYMASALLGMFAVIEHESSTETLLFMPLAVQEMVMAIWLIVRGFNPAAVKEERSA